MDRVKFTGLFAHLAANAGNRANLHRRRALVAVHAVDMHRVLRRDKVDQLLRAGRNALAARNTFFRIDNRRAVLNVQRVKRTSLHARAKPHAAKRTLLRAARDTQRRVAVLKPFVLRLVDRVAAAVAMYMRNHLFAGRSLYAHDLSNLFGRRRAADRAAVDRRSARNDRRRQAVTAREAAAAAVRARQALAHQRDALVDLDREDFGGKTKQEGE